MIQLQRGSVVTALFFKDKPRAGVIVRSSDYVNSENVTLCPITSVSERKFGGYSGEAGSFLARRDEAAW